jgi:NDP-sugar pyrophosphorylase family protein
VSFSSTTTISEAVVLAAGLGTRLRPFTNHAPKALMPLFGVPLLEWVLRGLVDHGVQKIVVNVHSHADQVEAWLSAQDWLPEWHISDERSLLLGSAGGPKKALSFLEEQKFFLLNADTLCFPDWRQFTAQAQASDDLLSLLLIRRDEKSSYTGFEMSENRILGFDSATQSSAPFYSGVGVFDRDAFQQVGEGVQDFGASVLGPALVARRVSGFFYSGMWLDIGTPQAWWQAHQLLLEAMESKDSAVGGDQRLQLPLVWKERLRSRFVRHRARVWSLPGLSVPKEVSSGILGTKDLLSDPLWSEQFLYSGGNGYRNRRPGIQAFGEFA